MTRPTTDQLIDSLFARHRAGESVSSILASLPVDLDGDVQRQIAELFAIEESLVDHRVAGPSRGFAGRVMAALEAPVASTTRAVSTTPRRTWGSVAAISSVAASLALAFVLLPYLKTDEPEQPITVAEAPKAPTADDVSVPEAVRRGTEAYMELVQSVAETMQAEPTTREWTQVASASPIGRTIEGSNITLRTAGEGLRASVEPITTSAIDAFGFLWRTGGPSENKPSI